MKRDELFLLSGSPCLEIDRNRSEYSFFPIFFVSFSFPNFLFSFPVPPFLLYLPVSTFCNHPFRAYKRILLCIVNVSSLLPCARNRERSKKGPGRNGGALCPEFVPRCSLCSFTRDDKSGVALTLYPSSHPLRPFLYRPAASILAYT